MSNARSSTLISDNFTVGRQAIVTATQGARIQDKFISGSTVENSTMGSKIWRAKRSDGDQSVPDNMNSFIFGANIAKVDKDKDSANNFIDIELPALRKILTIQAGFTQNESSDDLKTTVWTLGLWKEINKFNLANIDSGDFIAIKFNSSGPERGKLNIVGLVNGIKLNVGSRSPTKTFLPTDVMRLQLSFDQNSNQTRASVYNVTKKEELISVQGIMQGTPQLKYAGFGMSQLLKNVNNPSTVDSFSLSISNPSPELIVDMGFRNGLAVESAGGDDAVRYTEGNIGLIQTGFAPKWKLGQVLSRQSIYGPGTADSPNTFSKLPSGASRWSNKFKAVTVGPTNTPDRGVTLVVDANKEYDRDGNGPKFRNPNGPKDWPHLSVSAPLIWYSPFLNTLDALNFSVYATLTEFWQNQNVSGRIPYQHASSHQITVTIQNMGSSDLRINPNYHNMIWFTMTFFNGVVPVQGWDPKTNRYYANYFEDRGNSLQVRVSDFVDNTLAKLTDNMQKEESANAIMQVLSTYLQTQLTAQNITNIDKKEISDAIYKKYSANYTSVAKQMEVFLNDVQSNALSPTNPLKTYKDPKSGTQAMIYANGIAPFLCTEGVPCNDPGLQVGVTRKIGGDLLPLLKKALLASKWVTQDPNDPKKYIGLENYRINAFFSGWEVYDLSRVGMKIKDPSLFAVGESFPKVYRRIQNNVKEWTVLNATDLNDAYNAQGIWLLRSTTKDPQLIGPSQLINSDLFKKVTVRMKNQGGIANDFAQLFWKVDGDTSFSEANSQIATITNDGVSRNIVFDLSNKPSWRGKIIQLRFDPTRGANTSSDIEYIRVD